MGLDAVGGTRRAAAGVTAGAPGASDASDASGALSRTVRRRGREGISYLARCPLRRPAGPRGGRRRGRPSVRPSERGALRSTSSPRSVSAFAKRYVESLVFLRTLKLATPCHATTGTAPARLPTVCRARDSAARCILQRRNRRERDRGAAGAAAGHRRCRVRPSVVRRAAQSSTMAAAPNTGNTHFCKSALPCCCPTPSRPGRRAR